MTKLSIWELIAHHQPHHHTLHRQACGRASSPYDDAEICKPRQKCETTTNYNGGKRIAPASPEERAFDSAVAHQASNSLKKGKHVSFSTVEVRTYVVVVGDNRDVSFPLSLGWRYAAQEAMNLDAYETQNPLKRVQQRKEDRVHIGDILGLVAPSVNPLLETTMRPLTLHERRMVLRAQGHSEQQLRQGERSRRIELAMQWASGQHPKEEAFPYSQRFFLNYIL